MSRHALLPRPRESWRQKQRKREKRTRAGPKRRKGEEEGGRGEKTNPETAAPESRERQKQELPESDKKIHTKTHTRNQRKQHPIQITELVAQNPPQKRAVTKIEPRKNLRKGELCLCRFRDAKGAFLGPKILPKNSGLPDPKVRTEKPSEQKT